MPHIQLAIFDAYGVCITGGYPDTCRYLAKKYKREWRDLYDVLYTKYFNMAAIKHITQAEAWAAALKELNIPLTVQEMKKIHYGLMGLNRPVLQIVKALRKNIPVILLSKNTRGQFADINHQFPELNKVFGKSNVINTWEYNLPKASRETLKKVFAWYHVTDPTRVVYTDDQESNLKPAQELAVNTILYKNFTQFNKEISNLTHL